MKTSTMLERPQSAVDLSEEIPEAWLLARFIAPLTSAELIGEIDHDGWVVSD